MKKKKLTNKEKNHRQKNVIYAKKDIVLMTIIKRIIKSDIIVTTQENIEGAAHDICNLKYKTPKEIPTVFQNDSTYDYHFIIKELAKEFEEQFECLGGKKVKYRIFSVPINKKLDNGKSIK